MVVTGSSSPDFKTVHNAVYHRRDKEKPQEFYATLRPMEADLAQRQRDYRDSCGERFNQFAKKGFEERDLLERHTDFVYNNSCPTCRLYGSTGFIGRIAIGDAYLSSRSITEQRDWFDTDDSIGKRIADTKNVL